MTINPKDLGAPADMVLETMQKMILTHQGSIDVLISKAILKAKNEDPTEEVGNMDYQSEEIDWEDGHVNAKMLEVKLELVPQEMRVNMKELAGIFDAPKHVLLSESVPSNSIIHMVELGPAGDVVTKEYVVVMGIGLGRDGRAGVIYQIVPQLDDLEEVQDLAEAEIESQIGESLPEDEVVAETEKLWYGVDL